MPLLRGKLEKGRALVKVGIRPFQAYQPVDGFSTTFDLTFTEYTALIDTGALRTCVSEKVIADLQLKKHGRAEISNVKRAEMHWTYLFYVGIWPDIEADNPNWLGSTVIGIGDEIEGIDLGFNKFFDVLLGMDVISRGYLHIERDGDFILGFPDRLSG
jgi:hypothetical protein